MQTADLQTGSLYVVLPLPSLITNLTNLTELLVWLTGVLVWLTGVLVWLLTEVDSLANRSASLQVCSLHLSHTVVIKALVMC